MLGSIGHLVGGIAGGSGLFGPRPVQTCDPTPVAVSAAKLLQQGIGEAVAMATKSLQQVAGMPRFVAREACDLAAGVLDRLAPPGDPGIDDLVRGRCGQGLQDFIARFADRIVDDAVADRRGAGGGSWFEALAKALGKALDDQAAEVQQLSDAVQGQNASDNPSGFTDLQAASQRMSFMMSAADQVLKTLGEGLGALARK